METGIEIGQRITALKDASGYSWDRLGRMVYDRLGEYAPHQETIRAWGRGEVKPEKIDPVIVTALADVLGCSVADISTTAAATIGRLRSLLQRVDIDLAEPAKADETGPLSSGSGGIGWPRRMGRKTYETVIDLRDEEEPVVSRSRPEVRLVPCR